MAVFAAFAFELVAVGEVASGEGSSNLKYGD